MEHHSSSVDLKFIGCIGFIFYSLCLCIHAYFGRVNVSILQFVANVLVSIIYNLGIFLQRSRVLVSALFLWLIILTASTVSLTLSLYNAAFGIEPADDYAIIPDCLSAEPDCLNILECYGHLILYIVCGWIYFYYALQSYRLTNTFNCYDAPAVNFEQTEYPSKFTRIDSLYDVYLKSDSWPHEQIIVQNKYIKLQSNDAAML